MRAPEYVTLWERRVGTGAFPGRRSGHSPSFDCMSLRVSAGFRGLQARSRNTADGTRIDPLTVQDAASRYLLVCEGLERRNGPEASAFWSVHSRSMACPGPSARTTARRSPAWDLESSWASSLSVEPGHEQNRTLKAEGHASAGQPQAAASCLRPLQGKLQQREAARELGQMPPARSADVRLSTKSLRRVSQQRTDQVEGRRGVPERVAHRRAGGPCPAGRADLV